MRKQKGLKLKRTICLLLALSMMLTVLPFTVFAAEESMSAADVIAALLEETQALQESATEIETEIAEPVNESVQLDDIAQPNALPVVSSEEGIVGIMPLSAHRPAGIPGTITLNSDVTNEAQLRTALDTTDTRTIRIMNDIDITGAVMRVRGTKHVYSNSETPFAVTRTSGTARHIEVPSGTTHFYNVRLTRASGALRPDGSISNDDSPGGFITPGGPAGNGGGALVSGGILHLHAGAEISNNRTSGRGGGVNITGGRVYLNAGATISHNHAANTDAGGGGGVFVRQGGGRLEVNGGMIAYNHSAAAGGGISLAYNQTGSAAILNINNGIILRGNTAANLGGGIHANTNSNMTMNGVSIIEYNVATNGGGMRFFSGSATTINLAAGSIVRNNVARANGAGISIRGQNNVQLHVAGTLFEGNLAIGEGGAIRHEGSGLVDGAIRISDSQFINNRASNGGAISLVLSNNQNNLPANAITNRLRITNTTFEGNFATNGLWIDENLAARNVDNAFFAGGQVGSVTWFGPRTDVNGNVLAAEMRNHIWNNYDVVSRNRLNAREITFNPSGTASVSSLMEADLAQTSRSNNHTVTAPGFATTVEVPVTPPQVLESGDMTISPALANFRVTYHPWNADIIEWTNTQITREWIGDPVTGYLRTTPVTTTIPGSADALEQTITINQHTLIQPVINYRYHNIVFTASPSSPTTGGTVDGEISITRNLRESRSLADHSGTSPRGNPIGLPPEPEARPGWGFVEWTLNGTPITEDEIAAMYVSGPLTFVAVFALRTAHALEVTPTSVTRGNLETADFTAIVIDQFGDPLANQESFVINWTSSDIANVTISPASNTSGQVNTTTATVTLTAPEGSNSTITAMLSDTNISASGTVNVTLVQIPNTISVVPVDNYVFRGDDVELTAIVLNQFGDAMPDQDGFVINWTSSNTSNVTISTASNAAGQPNTTTATATATAAMGSSQTVTATLGTTTVTGSAAVVIGTTYELDVSWIARNEPVGMTVTVDGEVIAANTTASASIHELRPGDIVVLYAGSAPRQTFLGWMTPEQLSALPTNAQGNQYIPGFISDASLLTHNFTMLDANKELIAVWGNQGGVVSQYNDFELDVSWIARNEPTGMTVIVAGELVAANTGEAVGTHEVVYGDGVALYAGNAPRQTFLGWMTPEQLVALPTNAQGNQYIPGFAGGVNLTHSFTMPDADKELIAVWGNQGGVVSQYNGFDIIYNANGGINPPDSQAGLIAGTYPLTLPPSGMSHPGVVENSVTIPVRFVGWSLTQTNEIFATYDRDSWPPLVTEVTIVDADVTVHAVWRFANIVVDANYGPDGDEVLVDVNLPDDEYDVSLGNNVIIVTIPD
ncbi:MAG: hypothetical protein FWC75_03205, partial [Oscillospiraceae bacterium]|nr:hypothetical protein [Oscillospiraceae bacterium]